MTKTKLSLWLLGSMLAVSVHAGAAHAQATRTWVSGVGDDANPCSRTAPCKTFAGAISKTAAAGEINVLDPGGFGAVTITKSISIYNDGVGEAGVLTSGTNGIVISAQSTDVVNLRGLIFDGLNTAGSGIQINTAARVTIMNCVIQEYNTAGISVTPSTGTINVKVMDTTITGNAAGVNVKPGSGATVNLSFDRVHIDNNSGGGAKFDGTGGGSINGGITDSSVSLNGGNGVNSVSGPGNVVFTLMRVGLVKNGSAGIQSNGAAGGLSFVTVGESMLTENGTATTVVTGSGGTVLQSFGTNQVAGGLGSGFTTTGGLQ